MELYKKHRPKKLKQLVGNKELVSSLTNLFENEDMPHAILLTGPYGCGKTTVGRIIANELNVSKRDYVELDTGQFRGIDTVREVRKQMRFLPADGPARVWLVDEVHMLGKGGASPKNEAQQAFLKALEDTPEHVYFILCTTNPEMLNKTIKSRCIKFEVEPLTSPQMMTLLKRTLKKEKSEIPGKVLKKIVTSADGHGRDALQILQRVMYEDDTKVMLKLAEEGVTTEEGAVRDLCQALLKGENWNSVRKILQTLKTAEPEGIRRQIIGYANAVLLNGGEQASIILGWFLYKPTYDGGFGTITQFCYNICQNEDPPC